MGSTKAKLFCEGRSVKSINSREKIKQAGAELCQAQVKLSV